MEERNNRLLNAKLNKYIVPGIMMSQDTALVSAVP